jgi:hypothetical protein
MSVKSKGKPERTPLNAGGDFYVEKDMCLACMAPESEAPELMSFDQETGCYFKRQPQTPEEVGHALEAIRYSCIEALRYAGNDRSALERLRAKGCESQCDALSAEGDI